MESCKDYNDCNYNHVPLLKIMGAREGSKAQPRNYYNDPCIRILMYRSLLFENPECQWLTLLVSFNVLGVKYRLYCESVKICDL